MVWQAWFVWALLGKASFGVAGYCMAVKVMLGQVSSGYARLVVSGFRQVRFGRLDLFWFVVVS